MEKEFHLEVFISKTMTKAEQYRESLKSNISKYGTPTDEMENILRDYATDKDTLNGLCEEYLNDEYYKKRGVLYYNA